ncbi:recombinase family protein [Nonomuraea purpurea]|uniref:Recombinase family protein n=1 Tax=Nonomuraea purpurea TaxID=1849276 RepID=A0ABV8G6L4_9ACTN
MAKRSPQRRAATSRRAALTPRPTDSGDSPRRGLLYARLSESWDAAESVPTQLANGNKYATENNVLVVAEFKDDGYSAFHEVTRDGFDAAIEAIESESIDVVIVRDIDRLVRNLTAWNRLEQACISNGVVLTEYSTGAVYDLSTPDGSYKGGMEALRARKESAVKGQRVHEAAERQARKGRRAAGGTRRFGYVYIYAERDPEDESKKNKVIRVELHPTENGLIREAADRIFDDHSSVNNICHDWKGRGIVGVTGKPISVTTLTTVLLSAFIAGYREWDGQLYKGNWPAIISLDEHKRLRKILGDRAKDKTYTKREDHLLGGVLGCCLCKRKMYRRAGDNYSCVQTVHGGCGKISIKADLAEEFVTGAIQQALSSPEFVRAQASSGDSTGERERILGEIAEQEEIKAEARSDYYRRPRIIERDEWLTIKTQCETEIARLRRDYDRLSGESESVLSGIPADQSIAEAWESWSIDRRRRAIKSAVREIIVLPLPEGAPRNMYGYIKDRKVRTEKQLAIIEQRLDFDWRF